MAKPRKVNPDGYVHTRRVKPRGLELRRQLSPGPEVPAMTPKHPLEQAVEFAHGPTRRLDGDRAEIELLRHHHAARLGPRRHLLEDRDGVAHMHEEEPAEGQLEGRAGRRL